MLDLSLLRIMKYRKEFNQLYPGIPRAALDRITVQLLEDFNKYFTKFPTHFKIDLELFFPRFKQWHPTLNDDQMAAYRQVLSKIEADVDDDTKAGVMNDLFENAMAVNMANIIQQFENGELDLPLAEYLNSELDTFKLQTRSRLAVWNDTPLDVLFPDYTEQDEGIHWRLACLNESMRGMLPGDFGLIAGRPDKGKTSFLASEVTFMAAQLPADKNVLWFNNEGVSDRIRARTFQAAIGKTPAECAELRKSGELMAEYEKAVGRADKIRIFDIHGYHIGQVEALIENNNPGIIVYDMIDNIRGFGSEARTDLQLEKMYQWARERCVKFNCIGLAASQISAEGDGTPYPEMWMLKDSRTGKQGACDFQLMIGTGREGTANCRYVSLPKNKLRREGAKGNPQCEVVFDIDRARYKDIDIG